MDTREKILTELYLCEIKPEWGGNLAQSPAGKTLELAVRYREALECISLMSCRCIDDGNPCAGCTKSGREAPRLAYKTIYSNGQ